MNWRLIFLGAAAYNFAVGIPLVLFPEALYRWLAMPAGFDVLLGRLLGWLIATYGVSYVMVARRPAHEQGLVWLGFLGKMGVVVIVGLFALRGLAPWRVSLLAAGDFVWVLLFIAFLRTQRR